MMVTHHYFVPTLNVFVLLNSIDIEIQILMRRNLSHFCVASAHGEIWNPDEHGQKSLEIMLSLQIVQSCKIVI